MITMEKKRPPRRRLASLFAIDIANVLEQSPWLVRFVFKMECPLATDFGDRDLEAILRRREFDQFRSHLHYFGYVRLMAA